MKDFTFNYYVGSDSPRRRWSFDLSGKQLRVRVFRSEDDTEPMLVHYFFPGDLRAILAALPTLVKTGEAEAQVGR